MTEPKPRRIVFTFDERSLEPIEKLREQDRLPATPPDYEKARGCLDLGGKAPEKLIALQRGRGYDEVRAAAWQVVQAWERFCCAGTLATTYQLGCTIPALATLLRDIAPWEEPTDAS